MKTGRDVVIAALLGADEVGFATAPLVVEGCIMLRKCHLNTCSVGVATQDPVLRAKFSGKPEYVVNYFFFVAEEVRQIMAQLGIRKFDDLIGRSDLLDKSKAISHWKAKGLDFSKLLYQPNMPASVACYHVEDQDHGLNKALDNQLIAKSAAALEKGERVSFVSPVKNLNRTVGTMLSSEVARRYGHDGLPDDTIHIELQGTAGQSAAAFLAHGITLDLVGEGNDYVGKGLSGGRVIVRPSKDFRGIAAENMIVGNTVLYGAVSGEAFLSGVAGERFAVRNSGAAAVIEGVGDHGCEYMTGGTVVVLGDTGRNFAAGMSGGIAYVYDPAGEFAQKCNMEMVKLEPVLSAAEQEKQIDKTIWHSEQRGGERATDEAILKGLIERHAQHTGSARAKELLQAWDKSRSHFVKVFPSEYRRALAEMHAAKGTSMESLKIPA
jgi:glutamate synthase (NADPH/NADH) large chain